VLYHDKIRQYTSTEQLYVQTFTTPSARRRANSTKNVQEDVMGMSAETALVDYHLSFASQGKKVLISLSVCSK
jgi:hypothetical protein